MDNKFTISIAFAIFGMGCRMLVFMMGWDVSVSTQLYFLFLLLAIFFGVKDYFKSNPESNFGKLFKQGAQIGALFSLFVSMFTYVFYRFIDTTFFADQKAERWAQVDKMKMTAEQLTNFQSTMDIIFDPFYHSLITTMVPFMALALTYALIVGGILSKVPFFARNFK